MRRIMSFRDFDWTLLGVVGLLCTISVLEIYSATLHTKYVGFHTKQIYWVLAAWWRCSCFRQDRLSQADRLGSVVLWILPAGTDGGAGAGSGTKRWERGAGSRLGPCVSAIGVDEAGDDPGGSALLREPGRTQPDVERDLQSLRAGRGANAADFEAARPRDFPNLHTGL